MEETLTRILLGPLLLCGLAMILNALWFTHKTLLSYKTSISGGMSPTEVRKLSRYDDHISLSIMLMFVSLFTTGSMVWLTGQLLYATKQNIWGRTSDWVACGAIFLLALLATGIYVRIILTIERNIERQYYKITT